MKTLTLVLGIFIFTCVLSSLLTDSNVILIYGIALVAGFLWRGLLGFLWDKPDSGADEYNCGQKNKKQKE